MGSLVLVCAVLAAMAAGVLLAYGVCTALFSLFRMHARSVAPAIKPEAAREAQAVEA